MSAFAGYLAAGMTNFDLLISAWLAAAHISFVVGGYIFLIRLSADDRRLRRPFSIVYLCLACITGAAVAGAVDSGLAIVLAQTSVQTKTQFCFISEFTDSVIMLPMILAAPSSLVVALKDVAKKIWARPEIYDILPILALALTILVSVVVEGPGAFAYPVPALLWCALRYDLFSVTILTFLFSIWKIISVSGGFHAADQHTINIGEVTSLRLAIGLIALGPLAVASMNTTRNELIRKLRYAASHDSLTDAFSRSGLISRGQDVLEANRSNGHPTTIIMLDIDHFKRVNDKFGHAAGDSVLVEFAARVSNVLRDSDLFGRLGGEEFAVLLPETGFLEGSEIAEKIRQAVEETEISLPSTDSVPITVSGGIVVTQEQYETLDVLLLRADRALYLAKAKGRNTMHATETPQIIRWTASAG
ncbi:GGDEF domain-containing protein [Phyllobacterium sp. YR531]|uniref:GGDEF domain-containing protein n=1 Tax=Phyllobacterium sp. YR531 TaxID=1144343 RepID=UPI00068FB7BE|nr:GGDEF domain-containing protein [Phyllobacterium sp. YR531]